MDEYKKKMEFYSIQLIILNVNIIAIERFLKFINGVFGSKSYNTFFNYVVNSFFEVCILSITKLAKDQGQDFMDNLLYFKNKILTTGIKEQYKVEFRKHLKSVKLDSEATMLLERIVKVRSEKIAHFKLENEVNSNLNVNDIRKMSDELCKQFNGISFGTTYALLPWDYLMKAKLTSTKDYDNLHNILKGIDMDEIIDSVIKKSYLFNLPETNQLIWEITKKKFTIKQLEEFNFYRNKFGFSEV